MTSHNTPVEAPFSVRPMIDPSMQTVSPNAALAYAEMNQNIARDHAAYGDTIQQGHLQNSHYAISTTANVALQRTTSNEPRTALILGAGNCFDIPLPELVDSFDRVALVDVDTDTTEEALSDLSSDKLARVSLIKADVTGVMGNLMSTIASVQEENTTYSTFITDAATTLKACVMVNKEPDIGRDYAFVCSQLLLTQLCFIPLMHINRNMKGTYGTGLSWGPGESDEPLMIALNELSTKIQREHIAHLGRLVSNTGTVHFADTYAKIAGNPRHPMMLPMISGHVVKPKIDELFTEITPRTDWVWQGNPNDPAFYVASNSLMPKQ